MQEFTCCGNLMFLLGRSEFEVLGSRNCLLICLVLLAPCMEDLGIGV